MNKGEYRKLDIAREYLDLAMQLYIEKRNYFCSIHLAGAAEELFGAHLQSKDKPIHKIAIEGQKQLKIFETGKVPKDEKARQEHDRDARNVWTGMKNQVKHMNDGKKAITITDLALEAEHAIEAALVNFYKLDLQKSPTLWNFEDFTNEKMQKEISAGRRGRYP